MDENTTELVVTAPLDREESESYRLLLVCTVRTETVITKVETSLDVFVDDEDDNAPYTNGSDTADIVISFNRTAVRRLTRHDPVASEMTDRSCIDISIILVFIAGWLFWHVVRV